MTRRRQVRRRVSMREPWRSRFLGGTDGVCGNSTVGAVSCSKSFTLDQVAMRRGPV
jgi:hypothetical protein